MRLHARLFVVLALCSLAVLVQAQISGADSAVAHPHHQQARRAAALVPGTLPPYETPTGWCPRRFPDALCLVQVLCPRAATD